LLYPLVHFIGKKRELPISINSDKCKACGKCEKECPVSAISLKNFATIDLGKCIHCYHCTVACKLDTVEAPIEKINMERNEIINWLLEGDVSIQYQTHRDSLKSETDVLIPLKKRIATEGWGYEFLKRQHPEGRWGRAFYQPKCTSTNYTLLDLRNLCAPCTPQIMKELNVIVETCKGADGSINGFVSVLESDMCINGNLYIYNTHQEEENEKISYTLFGCQFAVYVDTDCMGSGC